MGVSKKDFDALAADVEKLRNCCCAIVNTVDTFEDLPDPANISEKRFFVVETGDGAGVYTVVNGVWTRVGAGGIDQVGITIDDGGVPITAGVKGTITVPYGGTISGWTALEVSDPPIDGTIVIAVYKDAAPTNPATTEVFTVPGRPGLITANYLQDTAPTFNGAGATVAPNDVFTYEVISADGVVEKVLLTLQITKA